MILIIYILAFIIQIVCLVKCFRNKLKWRKLIIFEVVSIFTAMILMNYYNGLPSNSDFMPGLTYFGEILVSFASMIVYIGMLSITLIIKIVLFLINKKKEGKDYFPKIKVIIRILAIIAVLIGIISMIGCGIHDHNTCEASAIIVDNVKNEMGWYHPVVQFDANGITYTVTAENYGSGSKFTLNEKRKIYYNKNNPNELTILYGNQGIVYLLGGSLLLLSTMIGKRTNT